jgi:glucokinase
MIGAVDIGGTKIAVGIVDDDGRVLARAECPTDPRRGPADGLDRISALLRTTAAQAGTTLAAIGIGCTGPVFPLTGTIGDVPFLPGWEGFRLADELATRFGVPAAMENDADAVALAEARWGAGRGVGAFIYVTVSTGIGAGMVFDGKLYRGVDGAHPEIGHHVIDASGPLCYCGARGCWESLASGPALAEWFEATYPGALAPGPVDTRQICDAAEAGDPRAQAAVDRLGHTIGLGLANLVTLFVPDVIALGGGVMQSRHLFWDRLHDTIRATCGLVPHERVRVVPAALGAEAPLVGAASVWLHRRSMA